MVKSNQTTQLSVVLKKVNKDSSRVYTVNGQEVIVTKTQLDEVAKVMKDNNIKEPKVGDMKLGRGSAAQVGGLAALVTSVLLYIRMGGFWVIRNVSWYCGTKLDQCVGIITGLIKGQQWAFDKARRWANGRD